MDHDVTIIGGGVIGCAIARELMRFRVRAVLVEAQSEVGFGTSKANSGIIQRHHPRRSPLVGHDLLALCTALRDVTVPAPVRLGDVILADALGTGIDVVASRDLPEVAHRAAAAADSA